MRSPKSANAGSKPDDDIILVTADENGAFALLNVEEESSSLDMDSSSISSDCSGVHSSDDATLEKCSVPYFAGYLIKKCLDRFKCKDCKARLEVPEDINTEKAFYIL
ncbi:hypothetical protein JTB14_013616 [Gonioctena quinquepunctata]|nr:hypothetical protein JTB14_013616 [Gonioctena quinquepunctata]